MITKRKVIIIAGEEHQTFLERFEALKFVSETESIQKIWDNNKTPIVTKEIIDSIDLNIDYIRPPEELLSIDAIEEFIEFCHESGFECGEYRTGQVFDTKNDRCFMCEMANHKGFSSLALYNQYIDRPVDCIIYESDNFYVVPELGALKQGYLMIVPKKHILSVAQFPNEYHKEYEEVCIDVEEILLKAFDGSMVCFMEHGSGPSGMTSHRKSIVHAHTHVVVDFLLKRRFKKMVQLKPCNDISIANKTHYFSYQEGSTGQLMISMDLEVYVQRQFPRQVMAEELGLAPNQYNWRLYNFDENTEASLFHLWKMLKEEKKGRIYERTKEFVLGFSKRQPKRDED